MKKFFIVSLSLFLLVGSFYLIYNFLLVEDDKESNLGETANENSEVKPNTDKLSRIVEGPVMGIVLDESLGKIQYYSFKEQGFWLASFDGAIKKRLSSDNWPNLKEVIWNNKTKKEVILKIEDSFYLYVFGNKEKFIKKSEALSWLNFNQLIVYTYKNFATNKVTLNAANPDGTAWREIQELETDNLKMGHIPQSAKSFFYLKPDANRESNLTIIPIVGNELEKKGTPKFGSQYLWSNDGGKFLRSSVAQKGSSSLLLEVCEARSEVCKNLNLPTMATKCVWAKDNKNIYCAAPVNLPENILLPNDYIDNKIFTKDTFLKINTDSGKKEKVIEDKLIKDSLDASELLLSAKEDFLFFVDRKSGGLFRIII